MENAHPFAYWIYSAFALLSLIITVLKKGTHRFFTTLLGFNYRQLEYNALAFSSNKVCASNSTKTSKMQSFITFSQFSSILGHSDVLNIVGLPQFLKCFPLLALIILNFLFYFVFSIGILLHFPSPCPAPPETETLHSQLSFLLFCTLPWQGHPHLLATSPWIKPQIILKPNLPSQWFLSFFLFYREIEFSNISNWLGDLYNKCSIFIHGKFRINSTFLNPGA